MPSLVLTVFLAAVAGAAGRPAARPLAGERELAGYTFERYLADFGKAYGPEEKAARAQVFAANMVAMREHNANPGKTWFAAPNPFTDWTNVEFRARRVGSTRPPPPAAHGRLEQAPWAVPQDLPKSVDWREKEGLVTAVKNQGGCGSCWAFSAVETLESHLAIATGEPAPVLSPQQVVSCSSNPRHCGGSGGCDGSTQPLAFEYMKTAGLSLDSEYPYEGVTGTCDKEKVKPVATNSGYVELPVNNYTALVSAVATVGPISISVAAGGIGWQLYGGGVFGSGSGGSKACGFDMDHAVQLVGYGSAGGEDYWIVRNSWGPRWGESGFMRMRRFGEGKEPCGMDETPQHGDACEGDTKPRKYCGLCGILSSSSYPTGVRKVSSALVV